MTDRSTSTPGLITWIAASRPRSGLALLVAGLVLAAIPAVLYSKYGTEMLSMVVLTGLMALVLLVAAIGQRLRPAGGGNPVDEARMLVLAIGGLIGLLVAVTGAVLAAHWWDFLTRWLR